MFHIRSGGRKSLGVNYWQILEMGHFTNIFESKVRMLFFNLLRQNFVDRSILPLLSPYHEYPVTFELMTSSHMIQRARPLRACMCELESQRVDAFIAV